MICHCNVCYPKKSVHIGWCIWNEPNGIFGMFSSGFFIIINETMLSNSNPTKEPTTDLEICTASHAYWMIHDTFSSILYYKYTHTHRHDIVGTKRIPKKQNLYDFDFYSKTDSFAFKYFHYKIIYANLK